MARFRHEFADSWQRLPDKGLFFLLLAAWLALFQFLGNSTFGYIDTPSLFHWMANAYAGGHLPDFTQLLHAPLTALQNTFSGDEGHGFLIPLAVLVLMWWKRDELLDSPLRTWWPGLLLVAASLVLHILAYLVQQPRVSVVALFVGIYGLMGLAWGPAWLRACFFPYFLFMFAVPLGPLTEPITFPLRLLVTKIVAFICQHVLAIDVMADGTNLVNLSSHYQYDVAAACSGIRSLVAITVIAIIYAFTLFRRNGERLLMVASAVPLAVIGNTFRLMAIVIAAEFGGQEGGESMHNNEFASLLPYIPVIVGLILIGRWLENRASKSNPPNATMREQPTIS